MRLRNFSIKGFKSIADLKMKDLDNLNILVGENNTGKSNILDAIHVFISNISSLNTPRNIEAPDELWPNAIKEQDIEWEAEIDFSIDEFSKLIQKTSVSISRVLELFGPGRWHPTAGGLETSGLPYLKINRVLKQDDKKWHYDRIQLNDFTYFRLGAITDGQNVELISRIDSVILNAVRGIIKRVDLVRGSVSRGAEANRMEYTGIRSSIVPSETLQSIVNIFTKWTEENLKRRKSINNLFGVLTSGCQVKASGEGIVIEDGESETPIHTVGGGIQEMLQLAYDLSEDCDILLLEEPESHLHPRLTQRLFHELKKMSAEKQIFIATHSSPFIDQADFSNIWLITKNEEGTKCERMQTDDNLSMIADELGILPSHACQSNCFLFVEGKADRIIFSRWFEVAGFPLNKPTVYLEEMNGKDAGKQKAAFWGKVAKAFQRIGLGLIFDSDVSPRDKEELEIAIGTGNRVWCLSKGTIEDYYPLDWLKSTIISEVQMGDELKESISSLRNGEIAKKISKILGDNHSWKVAIAKKAAVECKGTNDIPSEIIELLKELIEYIKNKSLV